MSTMGHDPNLLARTVVTHRVLHEVADERARQHRKWGEQDPGDPELWRHILTEEYAEALAEDDPLLLRAELAQVAAVAVAWIEAIDRREAGDGR